MSIKNSNDTVGNRTRDLPACSAMPQPIPPPRAPTLKGVIEFYVLLTVHPCTILQINPARCTILLGIFISLLYMFRATMCPSSGEITVSMRHWYLSLCRGGSWSAGWSFTPTSRSDATHTEWEIPVKLQPADQTPHIHSEKYQVSHRYSNFSWWWAHGCPKHVEKRNKKHVPILPLKE